MIIGDTGKSGDGDFSGGDDDGGDAPRQASHLPVFPAGPDAASPQPWLLLFVFDHKKEKKKTYTDEEWHFYHRLASSIYTTHLFIYPFIGMGGSRERPQPSFPIPSLT